MVRLTRVQQQRLTHERLLEAGREVFLRRGFLPATVEEIAAVAGYTRGAVYKHFGGKEGLWLAVVADRAEAHLRALDDVLGRASSREELLGALTPVGPPDEEAARWSAATAEVLAATAGQPGVAEAVAAAQHRHDERFAELLDRHCDRLGVRPALPVPVVVAALGALGIGLALRRAVDPGADVGAITGGVLGALLA
ncbi:TetR/AcrR family transcriptional regulator [Saccharothrix xinjiangensis]|uniref:TetR/AcrR family transcriptional regulator n=1 Tax=Saccharothrix xinjiangensis TaxID=204798 RepID=A0ABV9XXE4_9PSEU